MTTKNLYIKQNRSLSFLNLLGLSWNFEKNTIHKSYRTRWITSAVAVAAVSLPQFGEAASPNSNLFNAQHGSKVRLTGRRPHNGEGRSVERRLQFVDAFHAAWSAGAKAVSQFTAQQLETSLKRYYKSLGEIRSLDQMYKSLVIAQKKSVNSSPEQRQKFETEIANLEERIAAKEERIQLYRASTESEEGKVTYILKRLVVYRYSPATPKDEFERAKAALAILNKTAFAKIAASKNDSAFLTHCLDEVADTYSDLVERSRKHGSPEFAGKIRDLSGKLIDAPTNFLELMPVFSNVLISVEAAKELSKDSKAHRELNAKIEGATKSADAEDRSISKEQKAGRGNNASGATRAPQARLKLEPSAGSLGNISGGSFRRGTWVLTFDDGPHSKYTPRIIAAANGQDFKPFFFWLGQLLNKDSEWQHDLISDAFSRGMMFGSHSWSHRTDFARIYSKPDVMRKEFDQAKSTLDSMISASIDQDYTSKIYRCPFGSCLKVQPERERIAELGALHAFWNVDSQDWADKNPDSIVDRINVQMEARKSGIILMHDIHPQSAAAAELLMPQLKSMEDDSKIRVVNLCQSIDEVNGLESYDPDQTFCGSIYNGWQEKAYLD